MHEEAFNAPSREIFLRLDIFFDSTPLQVTKSNYLVDASWLEESGAESTNPFGTVSSNELSFRLFNDKGLFSPTNMSSPYYGKIALNVPIDLYIRASVSDDWIKLGRYYVSDWDASLTGTYADVIANDVWQQIFNARTPNYPVTDNSNFSQLFNNVYAEMGYNVEVDTSLNIPLPVAFIDGSPIEFTKELLTGSMSYCSIDKNGNPIISSFVSDRPIRATLTDSNQVKSVNARQSINKQYEGVELTYNIPNHTEVVKLLEISNEQFKTGETFLQNLMCSTSPVWKYTTICIESILGKAAMKSYTASPNLISIIVNNPADTTIGTVSVYGIPVLFTEILLTDDASSLLKLSSRYIQTDTYAAYCRDVLNRFVNCPIPSLTVQIRGNPLLSIGDRVLIQSTSYKINYDGVIQRLSYSYTGGLTCEMTLLNSAILEVT